VVALCGLGILLGAMNQATFAGSLRAGSARIDITPTEPVTLSGYESRKGLSQGVHDSLSARAVAFEEDGRKLVAVSTDIIAYYGTADRMRKAILEGTQLEPAELFLAAIHTHSAPAVIFDPEKGHSNNVAYSKVLQGKLVEVVRTALNDLTPVEFGFGLGASPIGANRRQVTQDDAGKAKIILGRNPAAAIDREVQVLKLWTPEKALKTVLFAYDTHSTSLGPRNYIISGDVHGLAEQFLEKYFGEPVVAAGFAGTSGDIDPWYRVLPEFKTTNGWIPETVLLGTLLGEEVAHVLEGIDKPTSNAPIRTLLKTIDLPGKPKQETAADADTPAVPFNVTVGCVGDLGFVGLGGEVFNEIGQYIKANSPFRLTFVMTHCNGAAGYLPTRASYSAGGYEVQSSPFGPGAAERVGEQAVAMLRELRR
jgi:hypothetical protein